ncbi:MAG TPA: mandelate racemase/muconate lactonizing enzyme family protein, partial [Chloroflexota bacterium]
MRIRAVTPILVAYPHGREAMSYFFLRIDADDGLVGYGEACDSYGCTYGGVLAAVTSEAYAPLLVGQELAAVEPLVERLRLHTRRRLGDQWVAPQARSAVEIALWDLAGKAAGKSVSALLGRLKDRVEVYASWSFLEEGSAEWHAERLAPALQKGVRMVKVRTGPDWQADLATLADLRGLLPANVQLMVDGSETYTLPTALEIAYRLHDLGVTWFEEPLPQHARAGIEELARKSPVAIAYGEHLFGREDALDALRRGQLSVLQPDASTCGGIVEAREMAGVAALYGARVVPHMSAGPQSLAANLQLAACTPSIRAIEYGLNAIANRAELGTGADLSLEAVTDGQMAIPDTPGLGVGLN